MWNRVVQLMRRRSAEREMAEELRFHLEEQVQRNIAAGMAPDEALRAARRQFGHLDRIQEEARDARTFRAVTEVQQDLKFALRMLVKRPGFTVAAGLTLALGIGLVTTIFSILNGVAFGRLPFPDSERVVAVSAPGLLVDDLAPRQSSLESLAIVGTVSGNFRLGEVVERREGAVVSEDFLRVLRTHPLFGRSFEPADSAPGSEATLLIGEAVWRDLFQSDPEVLGREVNVNGTVRRVIGVMPEGFGFPRHATWWIPRERDTSVPQGQLFGRLKAGLSNGQAAAEMTTLVAALSPSSDGESAAPALNVEVVPFAQQGLKGALRVVLFAIWGATLLVLLLACANVTNLVLARAAERTREVAIRAAVGATRGRLIRQMLTESVLLATIGGAGGALIASWSIKLFSEAIAPEAALTGGMPFWVNFNFDVRVLGMLVGLAVLAALLIGLAPALQSTRGDLVGGMKDGGGAGLRLSGMTRFLIQVQMALSVCLVIGAGLFVTVLIAFNQKHLPYDPLAVMTATLPVEEHSDADPAARSRLLDEVVARVQALPGVDQVALTSSRLMRAAQRTIEVEGHEYSTHFRPRVHTEAVSPSYFATLNSSIIEGRGLEEADAVSGRAVAVVSPIFVAWFGEGESLVGKRVRFAHGAEAAEWLTIVGVAGDVGSIKAGEASAGPVLYLPLTPAAGSAVTLIIRTHGEAARLAPALRRAVAEVDARLPLADVYTVQTLVELERIGINVPGTLFIVCGVGALLLAAVGVYGVISFSVRVRMREFGVRLALGATPADIVRHVLRQGWRQISIGLVLGVLLAAGLSILMRSLFAGLGTSTYNGWIYLAVVVLLATVGLAALWLPARRAAAADPLVALRAE
jgi:putative ABC transport system permease protein